MPDTRYWTTAQKQAYKRAKARKESRAAKNRALDYFVAHRWLPKRVRRRK